MPRWYLQTCDRCGGVHRSRAHAALAHGQKHVPRRSKRKKKRA